MIAHLASRIVSVSSTGTVSVSSTKELDSFVMVEESEGSESETVSAEFDDKVDDSKPVDRPASPSGKLIVEEEVALGHVNLSACAYLFYFFVMREL